MKRKFMKLDEALLRRIARDFSITEGTKLEIATQLTDYLKAYGLRWADIAARYDLPLNP